MFDHICQKCRAQASTRCARCGAPYCMAHLAITFIERASYLMCTDCREDTDE